MRRFVIGDTHGAVSALREVLKKSNFDYENDTLITLGDECDGHAYTKDVIDELLKIKNLITIQSNHNLWFKSFLDKGWNESIWLHQGGLATLESYGAKILEKTEYPIKPKIDFSNFNVPVTHQLFLNSALPYYIEDNMLFVHGGFDPKVPIEDHDLTYLIWDRSVIDKFNSGAKTKYDKVFIGHTTTQSYGSLKPIKIGKLIMMDTGVGWNGKLTIMDIDSGKFWQSKKQTPNI